MKSLIKKDCLENIWFIISYIHKYRFLNITVVRGICFRVKDPERFYKHDSKRKIACKFFTS